MVTKYLPKHRCTHLVAQMGNHSWYSPVCLGSVPAEWVLGSNVCPHTLLAGGEGVSWLFSCDVLCMFVYVGVCMRIRARPNVSMSVKVWAQVSDDVCLVARSSYWESVASGQVMVMGHFPSFFSLGLKLSSWKLHLNVFLPFCLWNFVFWWRNMTANPCVSALCMKVSCQRWCKWSDLISQHLSFICISHINLFSW